MENKDCFFHKYAKEVQNDSEGFRREYEDCLDLVCPDNCKHKIYVEERCAEEILK